MRVWALSVVVAMLSLTGQAAASGARRALIVHGKDESFNREASAFSNAAEARGYDTTQLNVWTLPDHDAVLAWIQNETAALTSGDRLLLTLNCHGGGGPEDVVFDPAKMRRHEMCRISSGDVERFAGDLKARGVGVVVFDNSCGGGGTVELLERIHVCAIGTVAPGLPSVTGTPAFSHALRTAGTFEDVALAGQLELFHKLAQRIGQKGYYSTESGLARSSAVFRSAFSYAANSLSEWQLQDTALHDALHPEETPSSRRKTVEQVLHRSEHYDEILDRAMAAVQKQWTESSGGARAGLFQEAMAIYRRENLLHAGLPPDIDALHERLRAEVAAVHQRRARLAQLVQSWEQSGVGVDEIKQLQAETLQHDADVSVMLGVSEHVDTKLDASPCRIGI